MKLTFVSCLLCTATVLLVNQQTMYVEAGPFIYNFFTLTTRAPCTGDSSTNCSRNNNNSNGNSSQPVTYNLLNPKIRLLTSLFQNFARGLMSGGSGGGAGGAAGAGGFGNFGFSLNKFASFKPGAASTTSTTTSATPTSYTTNSYSTTSSTSTSGTPTSETTKTPGYEYTEPDAVFKPDDDDDSTPDTPGSYGEENESIQLNGNVDTAQAEEDNEEIQSSSQSDNVRQDDSYTYDQGETASETPEAGYGYAEPDQAESPGYNYNPTERDSGYDYDRPAVNEVTR